jgi:hypothetical protein
MMDSFSLQSDGSHHLHGGTRDSTSKTLDIKTPSKSTLISEKAMAKLFENYPLDVASIE